MNRRTGARTLTLMLVLAVMSALSGCDTAPERAEKFYQSALSLLEDGDPERAMVELRNVFDLDAQHRDARALYARLAMEHGDVKEAVGQYLRLVEQFPEDVEGHLALAEFGIRNDYWEYATEHGKALAAMGIGGSRIEAVLVTLEYRDAVLNEDREAMRVAAERAQRTVARAPDSLLARSVTVDWLLQQRRFDEALAELDQMVLAEPDNRKFHRTRLAVALELRSEPRIESALREMMARFPDDLELPALMIRYFRARDDLDGAEAFLRGRITPGVSDDDARLSLINFIEEIRGRDEALAEVELMLAEGTNDALFRALRASMLFEIDRTQDGIAELQGIIDDSEPSEQTREIQVMLARILIREGNEVGARALVETVLEQDPGMVDALMLRAYWLIRSDFADQAIVSLRAALDQDPFNADVMTLMADAHIRNGDRDLAGEMLAQAVQARANAPAESLNYARFLVADDRLAPAESVLFDALRAEPENIALLAELGRIRILRSDWERAGEVERALRALETAEAVALADQMRLSILDGQARDQDVMSYLEALDNAAAGVSPPEVTILRMLLMEGDLEGAQAHVARLADESPDDPAVRFLQGVVAAAGGDKAGAAAIYRELIADGQQNSRVWIELARLTLESVDVPATLGVIEQGLAAYPDDMDLMWFKASLLEQEGQVEAAIAIYERMYERDTNVTVIANNLASLLASVREDEASLERAYRVARRLRDSTYPPFQDTYGWIAYRRGDYEEAMTHLERAVSGDPGEPQIRYHLGVVYEAMGLYPEALRELDQALALSSERPLSRQADLVALHQALQERLSSDAQIAQ